MDRILVTAVTAGLVLATVLAFVPIGTADGVAVEYPALNDQSNSETLPAVHQDDESTSVVSPDYLAAVEPQPTEDMPARLVIPPEQIERAESEIVTLDVGISLQSEIDAVENRHGYHLVQVEYQAASENERQAVLDERLTYLEERTQELQTREQEVFEQYSEGELSTTAFVTELALVHEEASGIEMQLEAVSHLDDERTFSNRITAVGVSLQRLTGPVRERAGATLAGEEPATDIYVEATHDGVILSTLDDGRYVREAHAHWNIDDDPNRRISYGEAANRFEFLYPWAWSAGHVSTSGIGGDLLYRGYSDHQHGELTAYLDPGSQEIFVEYHYLDLDSVPAIQTVTVEDNGLNVTVERTYAGGPALIDAGTEGAEVVIDGEHVGTTGDDGTLWIVEPRPVYDLSVTVNETTVSTTVEGHPEERLPEAESPPAE